MPPLSRSAAAQEAVRRLAWHWFRFTLPYGWEVTGYSVNPVNGSIDLASRQGYEGQITWRKTRHRPDEARILAEIHRRAVAETDPNRAETLGQLDVERIGPFMLVYKDEGDPCQAITYLEESRALVQLYWAEHNRKKLENEWRPLLQSYAPNDGDLREWSVFGLHMHLPSEFELDDLEPHPAAVAMVLRDKSYRHVIERRWGLPEMQFAGSTMEKFYRQVLRRKECRVLDSEPTTVRGYEAVRVQFKIRGRFGFERVVGRWWNGTGLIWHVPEEQRMYAFEQYGPANTERLEMDDVFPA